MELIMNAIKKREKFIDKFIDKNQYYKNFIASFKKFVDGFCYEGYLWDCIKNPIYVDEEFCINYIAKVNKNFYVLWDIHSKERILIENYWKYPKDAILVMNYEEYELNKKSLPEDIYIVDCDFQYMISLTHEFVNHTWSNKVKHLIGKRYCIFSEIVL